MDTMSPLPHLPLPNRLQFFGVNVGKTKSSFFTFIELAKQAKQEQWSENMLYDSC